MNFGDCADWDQRAQSKDPGTVHLPSSASASSRGAVRRKHRRRADGHEQGQLPLLDKPDDELAITELATLIMTLKAEVAPVQTRLRKLTRLHASKVANVRSRQKRGANAAKSDELIREEIRRLEPGGDKGVTATVAAKFDIHRRTVQRALKNTR